MWKGTALALSNVFVIALVLAVAERHGETLILVGVYGTIPAVIVGAFCGALASAFPKSHVVVRHAMIMAPAALLVIGLAAEFGMQRYIAVANIPTLVACLFLERWTRAIQPADVEQMPTARVA